MEFIKTSLHKQNEEFIIPVLKSSCSAELLYENLHFVYTFRQIKVNLKSQIFQKTFFFGWLEVII